MKHKKKLWIVKADGERQVFSERKLRSSLHRSGATKSVIDLVVSKIESEIVNGDSTRMIYKRAYAMLRKHKNTEKIAMDYNLRGAVMEMGPSGFAFEKFVGKIFELKGHSVEVGVMEKGWCTEHEVDVSTRKDGVHHLVECKFHNQFGVKSDLKVVLYVMERYRDIERHHEHVRAEKSRYHKTWLITNTKLTSKAIEYANCAGMNVVGWNHPKSGNLQDLILETGIHPVTALTVLSVGYKKQLMEKGYVLCRDIIKNPKILKSLGISDRKEREVLQQIKEVCN